MRMVVSLHGMRQYADIPDVSINPVLLPTKDTQKDW